MRLLFPLLVIACAADAPADLPADWSADGVEAPPPGDYPTAVSSLWPGAEARMTVAGLEPGDRAYFGLSTSGEGLGPCPASLSDCLDIVDPIFLGEATDYGDDWGSLVLDVPPGARIGARVWVQPVVKHEDGTSDNGPILGTVVDLLLCLDVWDPVCGVDGETYSNDCYAQTAGWPVRHDGECVD